MQDIIKEWPILSLLPMCTTDASLSKYFLSAIWQETNDPIWDIDIQIQGIIILVFKVLNAEEKSKNRHLA